MKRPLVPIALLFAGGILLGDHVSVPLGSLLFVTLALLATALAWTAARPYLLYPIILLTGWGAMLVNTGIISPNDIRTLLGSEPHLAAIRATLIETPSVRVREKEDRTTYRTLARASVSAIKFGDHAWQPAYGKVVITTGNALTNIFAGQKVEVSGVMSRPKRAFAQGLFDYRAYLERIRIYYELRASSESDWQIISSPAKPPLADRFRDWARKELALGLPSEDESLRLEWALTLGWKPALTEEVSEPFVQAATYHIFAVDGLRMAIISAIFFGLFLALRVPRAVCGLCLIPIIWFYVALTGWPASAIRASVMLTIVIVGWVLRRPSDLINSLFAAALIILVCDPQQLFQAGFQLSFFVVLALVLIIPPLHALAKRPFAPDPLLAPSLQRRWPAIVQVPVKYTWEILLTSFAAWIGSLPLVAYYFNIFTPVSTPANVLAVPLCALVLISNLASLLLAGFFPAAAEIFNHAGWALMELICTSSRWFAHWPAAYYYVPAPAWTTTVLYYAFLIAISTGWIFLARGRMWKWTIAVLLASAWLWQTFQRASVTQLTVLPEGGAASIFFDAPGHARDMLIDCGSANSFESVTKPFLRSRGVNHLDNLALTHADARHAGGIEPLVEIFGSRQVWMSAAKVQSPAYRNSTTLFANSPDKLKRVSRGDSLPVMTVLYPNQDGHFPHGEDNALVLLGQWGPTRVLLLSDLGREGQGKLLENQPGLKADILICGLPPHDEPLSNALLAQTHPQIVIITDAEYPASARAAPKLRHRLGDLGIPVLFTRSCGSVTIEFTRAAWSLRTMEGQIFKGPLPAFQPLETAPSDQVRR